MKLNLGLLFGGRSGEHEVSLQSAKSIAGAVDRNKYNLFLIALDKQGDWYLANEYDYLLNEDDPAKIALNPKSLKQVAIIPSQGSNELVFRKNCKTICSLDVVFPIIHGTFGEDGSLQGFMSMMNIPCVGADILGSAVGMDKIVAKQLLEHECIRVAKYLVADKDSDLKALAKNAEERFGFPLFVKPSCSGSSVGVYKAEDPEVLIISIKKALAFDRRVLIEEAIKGRELECAILGNIQLKASVPGEIIPQNDFYSYEAKYINGEAAKLELPAKLNEEEVERIQKTAVAAYRALSCSGMARVDMFLTAEGELVMNEINTLPGFTKISMYPKMMELSGVSFQDLINRLVELAIARHREQYVFLENVLGSSSY